MAKKCKPYIWYEWHDSRMAQLFFTVGAAQKESICVAFVNNGSNEWSYDGINKGHYNDILSFVDDDPLQIPIDISTLPVKKVFFKYIIRDIFTTDVFNKK